MIELKLLAQKHNLDWTTIQSFAKDCYDQGRQSIFLAQASGRLKRKLSGKPLGRPKGRKDSRGVKRSLIGRYKFFLKNKDIKYLSEQSKQKFLLKIEQIQSKKEYLELKEEISTTSSIEMFERLSHVKEF